jgi:hypothetical protein
MTVGLPWFTIKKPFLASNRPKIEVSFGTAAIGASLGAIPDVTRKVRGRQWQETLETLEVQPSQTPFVAWWIELFLYSHAQ